MTEIVYKFVNGLRVEQETEKNTCRYLTDPVIFAIFF